MKNWLWWITGSTVSAIQMVQNGNIWGYLWKKIHKIRDVNSMKRFIKILNWCKKHPLERGETYEISAYVCNHLYELGLDSTVSQDEIACCYKLMGYDVEKIPKVIYVDGNYLKTSTWKISTRKNK